MKAIAIDSRFFNQVLRCINAVLYCFMLLKLTLPLLSFACLRYFNALHIEEHLCRFHEDEFRLACLSTVDKINVTTEVLGVLKKKNFEV